MRISIADFSRETLRDYSRANPFHATGRHRTPFTEFVCKEIIIFEWFVLENYIIISWNDILLRQTILMELTKY